MLNRPPGLARAGCNYPLLRVLASEAERIASGNAEAYMRFAISWQVRQIVFFRMLSRPLSLARAGCNRPLLRVLTSQAERIASGNTEGVYLRVATDLLVANLV